MTEKPVFGEYRLPGMDSGRYRFTAGQVVADEQLDDVSVDVEVTGLRFTLPTDRVHGRFPAPGSSGDFGLVLPHIVLTSDTLPWQRELRSSPTSVNDPWLALLVFDHGEVANVASATVESLLADPAFIGCRDRETGDETTCRYLELDEALFDAVLPDADSLRWLTHVRETRGEAYSVVVAGRLPAADGIGACCLVSLEGAWPRRTVPGGRVRVAVLDTWTFHSETAGGRFGSIVGGLDAGPLRIDREGARHEHGYAALPHTMRQGALSASWYRGPLIPPESARSEAAPGDTADELLRYDPELGMFDVSLAAAWQLGRLLALADAETSSLIAAWKAEGQRSLALAGERELLAAAAGVDAVGSAEEAREQFVEAVLAPAVKGIAP